MDRFDSYALYRPAMVAMFALTVFACEGGGCSSCEGCGVRPIPGAFPLADRIDNSAQVRLTSSGIDFIESNIGDIATLFIADGLRFPVGRQTIDGPLGIRLTICEDDNCALQIEINDLELQPEAPNRLRAAIRVILDSRDLAGSRRRWPGSCDLDLDTRRGDRDYVGLVADVVFTNTTQPARQGYTRVALENVGLASGEDIENADIDLSGGFLGSCNLGDIGFIKSFIIGLVEDQLSGVLDGALDEQLCQRRGEFGCPTGTFSVPDDTAESVCRFENRGDAECVPILLGTDGQGDLGGTLLGGFSPGTHAYGQFLLASGGEGEAVDEGMSLFFFGGFRGTDRTFTNSPAHHPCVPGPDVVTPPELPTIPRIAAFRSNTIPGTTTATHVGIGLSEAYLDYAGYGLFDSGMLCLGAGTRLSQQLSTGLVSALIQSLPDLTFPISNAALTIAVRPQRPPEFTIGTGTAEDPLLQILLPVTELDFYVWSTERYVRFMTFQTDLEVGVDLSVEANQLVPTIRYIQAGNSTVSNSELLAENPTILASTLESIIQSFAGMFTSGLSPFDLPAIMGFELDVPPEGIRRVQEGDDRFLGIFANLRLATGPAPLTAPVETRLELSDLRLDRESMHPAHWNEGEGNSVWLHFDADGPSGVEYEYSYRIDGGPWSAWTRDSRIRVQDEVLLLQARHEVEARARVAGEPASVDETPARASLLIDILAPTVRVERTADGVVVTASDVITAAEQLEVRYRIGGTWTDWGRTFRLDLPYDGDDVAVEVRDEAGNVGSARAALIRGLPNPNAGDGCGCSAPGTGSSGLPLGLLGLLGAAGVVVARRRRGGRRLLTFLGLMALPALAAGCDCSGEMMPVEPCEGGCRAARLPNTMGEICCEATDMCVGYDLDDLCEPGFQCTPDNVVLDDGCGVSCSTCTARPALEAGILATYLDAVLDAEGNVAISGYSPGVADGLESIPYGDLVFGQWNGSSVSWEIVDGAPSMPVTNDPSGWRGGVSAAGPDVGQWTSIGRLGSDYVISYYDVTNGALKVALGSPGAWQTHTVDDAGDAGRYSSLVVTPEGVTVVAYLRIEESTETPGQVVSTVMVATANVATPSGPTDWTLTEVTASPMPCRAQFCESAPTCLASGQCVRATTDCASTCDSPSVCFNGSCVESIPSGFVEDLVPAVGLYTSLAVDPTGGLGLVYYDRTAGDVYGVRFDGSAWGTPFLIDGYARNDPFVGDSGQSANLAIDSAGLWHVAYVDGAEETLRYAQVQSNGTVVTREVVDDGSTIDGTTRHSDGRHIVGDDASVVVLEGGGVRIAYQDATAQNLVVSARAPGGGAWTINHVDTEDSTGYWADHHLLGTTSYIVTWWRSRMGRSTSNGVRVVIAD
jgi:MYXO-CTERM domain-containing protein